VGEASLLQEKALFLPSETNIAKTIGSEGERDRGLHTLLQDFETECETPDISQNLPLSAVTALERTYRGL
jgi:hypothetical protein